MMKQMNREAKRHSRDETVPVTFFSSQSDGCRPDPDPIADTIAEATIAADLMSVM